jgi:hypothetical protein
MSSSRTLRVAGPIQFPHPRIRVIMQPLHMIFLFLLLHYQSINHSSLHSSLHSSSILHPPFLLANSRTVAAENVVNSDSDSSDSDSSDSSDPASDPASEPLPEPLPETPKFDPYQHIYAPQTGVTIAFNFCWQRPPPEGLGFSHAKCCIEPQFARDDGCWDVLQYAS